MLNEQRKQVYARRQEILRGEDIRDSVLEWLWDVIEAAVDAHAGGDYAEEWDWDGMWVALGSIYPIRIPQAEYEGAATPRDELIEVIYNDAVEYYEEREQQWAANNPDLPRDLERWITLQVTDTRWREHLDNMDYMRQGIGLRGYAQKDPLVEYRQEGQEMFNEMSFLIKQEAVRVLMHAEVEVDAGDRKRRSPAVAGAARRPHVPPRGRGHAGGDRGRVGGGRPGGRHDDAGGRAAPARPGARCRPQRPLLVWQRQEVQAVPWRIARPPPASRGRWRI